MSPKIPRFQLNDPLSVIRRVTVHDDRTVTVAAANEVFRGRIYLSRASQARPPVDSSRRASRFSDHDILWYLPKQPIPAIRAGDRFRAAGVDYEALTGVRERRAGDRTLVHEVWCASVASLYPVLLDLTELGGEVVQEDVPAFVWETAENDTTRGTYKRVRAEVPVEFYAALSVTNRELRSGSTVHHIDQVMLHLGQPHVSLELRAGVHV
jgi:hypothetical protein